MDRNCAEPDAVSAKPFDLALIVDDDPDILLAARLLLRDLFTDVIVAERPDEALARTADRAPDVILLDANFARGATNAAEGFEALARFIERDPEAVVVMITAHGGVQIAVEAMKRGATDFVSKPWSNERLLATVRTAAALRQSRNAVSTERQKVVAAAMPAAGSETPLRYRQRSGTTFPPCHRWGAPRRMLAALGRRCGR